MGSSRDKAILLLVVLAIIGAVLWYRNQPEHVPAEATAVGGGSAISMPDSVDELKHFVAMFNAHPDHSPIALQIALLYSERKNHAEAIRYFKTYLKIDTSSTAWEARLDLAKEYFVAGMRDSARAEIAMLEEAHPEHVGVLYNAGAIAANDSDFEKARRMWEKAVELAPNSDEGKMSADGLKRIKS